MHHLASADDGSSGAMLTIETASRRRTSAWAREQALALIGA